MRQDITHFFSLAGVMPPPLKEESYVTHAREREATKKEK
jgi:hypothetical protein